MPARVTHETDRPRRPAGAVLLAVLVLAVAACGGSESSGPEIGEAEPQASQTLRVSGFGTGDEIANIRAEAATQA